MKIITERFNASSIAVKKELYDFLNKEANYVSQIPKRFEGWQAKPQPYFILDGGYLKNLMTERKEKQMSLTQPNKETIIECDEILKHLSVSEPVLVYVSLTA